MISQLSTVKKNIKDALLSKNAVFDGGMVTYADSIRNLGISKYYTGTKFFGSESTQLPYYDTSDMVNFEMMFNDCKNLTSIELYDTSNAENMYSMFGGCHSLTTVPAFDTSKVMVMQLMFVGCTSLTTIPAFDTSKVVRMDGMFAGCTSLTTLPELDCSMLGYNGMYGATQWMFSECSNLRTVYGLKNIGRYYLEYGLDLSSCVNLTHASVINIFNGLYDRGSNTLSPLLLTLPSIVFNKLTDADIAIATNKGWVVSMT